MNSVQAFTFFRKKKKQFKYLKIPKKILADLAFHISPNQLSPGARPVTLTAESGLTLATYKGRVYSFETYWPTYNLPPSNSFPSNNTHTTLFLLCSPYIPYIIYIYDPPIPLPPELTFHFLNLISPKLPPLSSSNTNQTPQSFNSQRLLTWRV